MSAKHTPGPLTVDRVKGRWDGESYPVVAGFRVSAALYRIERDTVEANARLFAAAPEMAETLRGFVDDLDFIAEAEELELKDARKDAAVMRNRARTLLARIDGDPP